ncbi:3-deoxy-manno-octulosonate cytidylyltransferase [Streptomyces sp. NPDC001407]|uniref:3-deoxy-manno-octulosonate cytidylyltransferase n=1 Tax=Streptomyces sp. NPDC001407 TaxID=3364573 RepID=UPI0036B1A720
MVATRRHIAIIPCRWGASRFPGKPLAILGTMPLLWHVHRRCQQAHHIDDAVVATDDDRIEATCRQLDIPCIMTGEHPTGTDRVAECAQHLHADAYINVQGDEPFVAPEAIDAVSDALARLDTDVLAVNAYATLSDAAAVLDHNVVKVIVGDNDKALLFSRQPIPYPKSHRPTYLRQLGLYGFTRDGLGLFQRLEQGPVERAEGIEMLRLIEHGHGVRMLAVSDNGIAIDTPEDLERARALL